MLAPVTIRPVLQSTAAPIKAKTGKIYVNSQFLTTNTDSNSCHTLEFASIYRSVMQMMQVLAKALFETWHKTNHRDRRSRLRRVAIDRVPVDASPDCGSQKQRLALPIPVAKLNK